jgi:hypothetical protein
MLYRGESYHGSGRFRNSSRWQPPRSCLDDHDDESDPAPGCKAIVLRGWPRVSPDFSARRTRLQFPSVLVPQGEPGATAGLSPDSNRRAATLTSLPGLGARHQSHTAYAVGYSLSPFGLDISTHQNVEVWRAAAGVDAYPTPSTVAPPWQKGDRLEVSRKRRNFETVPVLPYFAQDTASSLPPVVTTAP